MSNHYGNTGGGHYTAFAKHPLTGEWFDYDDSSCQRVNPNNLEEEIVGPQAYSIFYRRRDTVDLSKIDFAQISKLPNEEFL